MKGIESECRWLPSHLFQTTLVQPPKSLRSVYVLGHLGSRGAGASMLHESGLERPFCLSYVRCRTTGIWTNLLRNRGSGAARKPSNFPPTSEDDVTNKHQSCDQELRRARKLMKSKSTKYPECSSLCFAYYHIPG